MIVVHGYMGDTARLRDDVADATVVVGGRRHLDAAGVPEHKRVVLGPLNPAIDRMKSLGPNEDAVVIASGDPLFYGIGRRLRREGLAMRVVPAPTSVAAAFAAVCLPWDDAAVVSAHSHDMTAAVEMGRTHPKVAVLTTKERGVREMAAALTHRWFVLAECLGERDERVRQFNAAQAAELDPNDIRQPNVVLILAAPPSEMDVANSPAVAGTAAQPNPPSVPGRSGCAAPVTHTGPVIGQVLNSPAALRHAEVIDTALDLPTRRYHGQATEQLPMAWAQCDLVISHLALGATARILSPLLANKRTDPGVVVVDEAGRFAVPLVGGHAGGANDLALRVAAALDATAVVTTATDAVGLPALDTLGWAYHGNVAAVTRAMLDGRPVAVERDRPWPLPPLPYHVGARVADPVARIVVTDSAAEPFLASSPIPTVVLHPKSLVVGMGCNRGTSVKELRTHLHTVLDRSGLAVEAIAELATHELKAEEEGLVELAAELGVTLRTYPAHILAAQPAPTASPTVANHVGTPSVSEAAVLARGAELVVPKQKSSNATAAVGRLAATGKLWVVGIGPGARDLLTPRAADAIRRCTFLIGYAPYVRQVKDLARPGCRVAIRGMGTEEQRTAEAIEVARSGEEVVLVSSGDPSMYAMASPVLEQGTEGIEVEIVPGVTAALAASAALGAPLGHDHCTVSLSDLHTPWNVIEERLKAAAVGDFVVALYNPRSRQRSTHLPRALEILAAHRAPTTPVAMVREVSRTDQSVVYSTLAEFDPAVVDMKSLVIVGSSRTAYVKTGDGSRSMVTPRDYQWMPSEEEPEEESEEKK